MPQRDEEKIKWSPLVGLIYFVTAKYMGNIFSADNCFGNTPLPRKFHAECFKYIQPLGKMGLYFNVLNGNFHGYG